jgi:hypothetical protein
MSLLLEAQEREIPLHSRVRKTTTLEHTERTLDDDDFVLSSFFFSARLPS